MVMLRIELKIEANPTSDLPALPGNKDEAHKDDDDEACPQ